MELTEAVATRFSARAFLDRPVSREQVERILTRARQAPSGGNVQPWHVWVLTGKPLADFKARFVDADPLAGEPGEFDIYPSKIKEPYRARRHKCGEDLYGSINVPRDDRAGRISQYAKNLQFFGAPMALFFGLDRTMGLPQWAHLGMFMQTIMLLAREEGMHTCAQEVWAHWHDSVTEVLAIPDHLQLYCGMALGYLDETQPINQWRTDRAPLDEFVTWQGFEER